MKNLACQLPPLVAGMMTLLLLTSLGPTLVIATPWQDCVCFGENCSSCGQTGGPSDCQSCPQCHNDHCVLSIKQVCDEKLCYKTEQKVVCIPKVHWPWDQDCRPVTSKSRTVNVLEKHVYQCSRCAYVWEPAQPGRTVREISRPIDIPSQIDIQEDQLQNQAGMGRNGDTDSPAQPPVDFSGQYLPTAPVNYAHGYFATTNGSAPKKSQPKQLAIGGSADVFSSRKSFAVRGPIHERSFANRFVELDAAARQPESDRINNICAASAESESTRCRQNCSTDEQSSSESSRLDFLPPCRHIRWKPITG